MIVFPFVIFGLAVLLAMYLRSSVPSNRKRIEIPVKMDEDIVQVIPVGHRGDRSDRR